MTPQNRMCFIGQDIPGRGRISTRGLISDAALTGLALWINALMLMLTSWITEHTTHWGLYIDDFWWTAIWAAIVLSIVSWLLSLVVRT